MSRLTDEMTTAAANDAQYDDGSRLATRISVWQPAADGRDPTSVAVALVVAEVADGGTVLEAGCGTGTFAARVRAAAPGTPYVATDRSAGMVEATAALGVEAHRAEADALPVADRSADVVVANWMLYHVPDLDAALAEFARVLRPGGLLVAVTNGDEHLAALLTDAGGDPVVTQFSRENGEAALGRHFTDVARDDLATRAVFPDHAAALAYLATFDAGLAAALPPFDGPREYAGATTVFTARRTR